MGCITVKCNRVGGGIRAQCNRIGKGLTVDASLVCSINLGVYLDVSKRYLFLTPENNNIDYVDIISNVKWDIH